MHPIDKQLSLMLKGKFEEAWEISEELEKIGPEEIRDPKGEKNPEMWLRHSFNRGWFLLQQGKYQEGCQKLEAGRFINVYGGGFLKTKAPLFNPQEHKIKGKSIIISLEGGYGDEIIHARFATSFKKLGAKNVYIACAPEIVTIVERIEGVDKVILRDQAHTVEHDYWVPGFSAGWIAGHTFEDLPNDPYIAPVENSVSIWKEIIKSDKVKVGIRWAGNPKFEHQQFRRFPTEFITNLSKYKELQLYSLQRDHNTIPLESDIIDLQHFLISWEDTLAAIANLDILITSCTAVAHFAAAMGKEVWVIVPILPYHIWTYNAPESTTSPYYKTVKVYRQQEPEEWNDTFQKLYADLEEKFNLEHIDMPSCDKEVKRLNLGCGFDKLEGYTNVDISEIYAPDEIVDLEQTPWPWKDNEFSHIVLKEILEHLGKTPESFKSIIKELYRISDNGAIWEVEVPHWRSDNNLADPTHVRSILPQTFNLLDRSQYHYPAFDYDVDMTLCDYTVVYNEMWLEKLRKNEIGEEELNMMLNTMNNIASSVRMLIQVHKPGRISIEEFVSYKSKK